jgi:hypothetical protein
MSFTRGYMGICFPWGMVFQQRLNCRHPPDFPTRYRADLKNIVFDFAITHTSKTGFFRSTLFNRFYNVLAFVESLEEKLNNLTLIGANTSLETTN